MEEGRGVGEEGGGVGEEGGEESFHRRNRQAPFDPRCFDIKMLSLDVLMASPEP